MSAYTPGPWLTDDMMPGDKYRYVYAAKGPIVCRVNTFAAGEANARLISAAPELLAALKDVVCHAASEVSHCAGRKCRESHCADCMGEESAERYIAEVAISVEAARAAIAKAEGRA